MLESHHATRIVALTAALTLLLTAGAQAATRYASSTSATTTGACDTPANACKLSYALSNAGASDSVRLLSDGTYTLDASMTTSATSVSGDPAQPRPVIADPSNTYGAFIGASQTWRHLDFRVLTTVSGTLDDARVNVQLAALGVAMSVGGGTLTNSQVTVTSAAANKTAIVASTNAALKGDIVTINAPSAVAVDATSGNVVLRGVTAIATGTSSIGLRALGSATGIGGPPPNFCFVTTSGAIDAVDVIARGDSSDVAAMFTTDGCIGGGTPSSVRLRSSNFRGDHLTMSGGTIDSTDTANQTTAAQTDPAAIFVDAASGNYHERSGAPTIDAGSGLDMPTLDADGEQRKVGPASDIGGDESQVATVAGGAASDLATSGAKLSAAVSTADGSSTIVFEYGTTTAYGSATPAQVLASDAVQQPAAAITGLAPATTYHFHAVVTTTSNGATRTASGPDVTFTTPAAPAGGGGGGGGGGTTSTPAFVAKGLTAPSRFSRRTLGRLGLTVHLQIGALGSKIKASLFTGGVKVRAAAATAPVVSKTITVSGAVTLRLKPSKSALRKLRTAKKLTLVVTVTPPAGSSSAPVTLTKTITLTA